jgi:membrane protein DedA with SNARE-associated domain
MDLNAILEVVRSNGDAAYAFLAAYAASNSLLLPLFAGYAAHMEAVAFWPAVWCVWIGGVVGDEIRFEIGRRFGTRLFEALPRVRTGLEVAARLADRHQIVMAFAYRYPHLIRGFGGFAFGMSGIARLRFTLLNVLSAAIWAPALVGAGYGFGHLSEQALGDAAGQASLAMLAGFLLLAWWLSRRLDGALPDDVQGKRESAYSHSDR